MIQGMAGTAALAGRISEVACVTGAFTLADGTTLKAYFDEYRLAADPQLLRDVARAMAVFVPEGIEVLAGIELGGVPLAVALSAATGLPTVFLRRVPKDHGSQQQIEGTDVNGRRIALVDDVIRSGGQLLAMARTLRVAGAHVSTALCVLERPLGGRSLLAEHGVALRSLLAEADLPEPQGGAA
jgi:orotate phosphoribosyltransferase